VADVDENSQEPDRRRLEGEGSAASRQTGLEDVAGAPTWPIPATETAPAPPPVGLNWGTVAERLSMDRRILQHEGLIVLAGEYFPEAGFFLDPATLDAQHVDVGDIALRHGYFIGNLSAREFSERLRVSAQASQSGRRVVHAERGPIIGLFADERSPRRVKTAVLQGAVGAEISIERGPLGLEVRVGRVESGGTVASLIASHEGAVISIAGKPVAGEPASSAPMSTAPDLPAAEADAYRPGTGVTSDSQAPARRPGSSEERMP
jgi:hypothetical protein